MPCLEPVSLARHKRPSPFQVCYLSVFGIVAWCVRLMSYIYARMTGYICKSKTGIHEFADQSEFFLESGRSLN